jgi:hypothetical protein
VLGLSLYSSKYSTCMSDLHFPAPVHFYGKAPYVAFAVPPPFQTCRTSSPQLRYFPARLSTLNLASSNLFVSIVPNNEKPWQIRIWCSKESSQEEKDQLTPPRTNWSAFNADKNIKPFCITRYLIRASLFSDGCMQGTLAEGKCTIP